MTGTELPRTGQIIFGDIGCTKRVNISELVKKAKHTVEQITKECESDEQRPVVLNKHCQICDFQARCRGIAVNREHLSLLATMTEKERQEFIEKGGDACFSLLFAGSMSPFRAAPGWSETMPFILRGH